MNYTNPFDLFSDWFNKAGETTIDKPNAMVLATISSKQIPTSRMVLLSSYDESGFVFHSNYASHKASQLSNNPHASLLFWWDELGYQIRIEGQIDKTSDEESDQYFSRRPRSSQIGAWASKQSQTVIDRTALEQQVTQYTQKFEGDEVQRPHFWGGYRLKANLFEFWVNRESRLHDRIEYQLKDNEWQKKILAP
ncbi:Pyridoxamine 5'-phosphate oxidase [hydrothermal vent metagenome]|uniref:Pyridoxamine 5'-phosphate oxidase n=1 Tax=hydrothermal vent metagenome TaxID=652676 RepID=A0A3B0ZEJ4_9ZZZZ